MAERFENRVVYVTGAGSGIGAAVALRAAAERARVALVDRQEANLRRVTAQVAASGGLGRSYVLDVRSPGDVARSIADVVNTWGRLDVLINNAGVAPRPPVPLVQMSDEDYHGMMDGNFWTTFVCTRAAVPHMIAAGYGRIVNVSSRAIGGEPDHSVYVASKSAMTGFSNCLVWELGPHGITVNTVAPGPTTTSMRASHPDHTAQAERLVLTVPMRRMGTTNDQAATILFLASEEAGYISGETIMVSGGQRGPMNGGSASPMVRSTEARRAAEGHQG